MNNLFSVFDPQTNFNLTLNWFSSLLVILMFPISFWMMPSQLIFTMKQTLLFVHGEFKAIFGPLMVPGATLIMVSFFGFIALNNALGLLPYIFTSSSHLTFTVALALPLWVGHMMYAWVLTPNSMLAHLVPMGTPYALMPFMVLIELSSNLIRPLTLAVRLAANMVAGHLLLTLLGGQAPSTTWMILAPLLSALIALCVLESAVALIQAYVFSVLSALYVNEVNNKNLL